MAQQKIIVAEGQSTNRPPLFDGSNYPYWSTRMSIYIRAINYEMWDVIIDGPFMPLTINVVTNKLMPKPRSEWTEAETKKVQVNFKAINTLHCALTPTEFNKVSSCTTTKQVWEKLRIIHEGTSQVKESKIDLLTHSYEMFKMEPGEDITSMFDRRNRRLTRRGFRKDQGASWKIRNKNDSNKKEEMICYECKKPGHFKSECPLPKDETPKKNKRSKKAMVAVAWSDSDTSSFEIDDEKFEERANICLMAQEDETELKKRKGGTVSFRDDSKGKIHDIGKRLKNMYVIFLEDLDLNSEVCFVVNAENDSWLWHRRLGHVSMHTMSKLIKKNLVAGLSKLKFEKDRVCDACQLGKQVRTSFKTKKIMSTSRPLELLHIDLFGPINTTSLGGKSYGFVIVDDYSRYTWVYFFAHKNDALQAFLSYCKKVENEKGLAIVSIRSDHGEEFENDEFEKLCNEEGLDHNFSAPRTPQQNGVVERKTEH
ncbi:Integrase [Theobroma cacao]|nr:Integrase [Theobroma cacao]